MLLQEETRNIMLLVLQVMCVCVCMCMFVCGGIQLVPTI
jgi:TRAP-type C4-dicarboxylate transport system permease small subunit